MSRVNIDADEEYDAYSFHNLEAPCPSDREVKKLPLARSGTKRNGRERRKRDKIGSAKNVEEFASLLNGNIMCNEVVEQRQRRSRWPERMRRLHKVASQREIHALGISRKMGTREFTHAAKTLLEGRNDYEAVNYW